MNIKTHGKSIFLVCSLLILGLIAGNSMALDRDPGTVIYLHDGDFPDWDPAEGFDEESLLFTNVYETLLYYNPPGSAKAFKPGLATSWEASADGMTWTFHLRKGVKFHDGEPFTAAAVKYSIERNRDSKRGGYYIWLSVKEVKIVDDYTVQIITKEPAPIDLIACSGYSSYIYSPKVEEKGGRDWFMKGNALGTGPYKVEKWIKDQEIILTKNTDYWAGWQGKHFNKVIIKRVAEKSTRVQMMKAGEADFSIRIPMDSLEAMKADPNIEVLTTPSWTDVYMRLNTQKFPTDNLKVRQAIQHAFDRKTVVESIYNGYAEVAQGPVPATLWGHNPNLTYYEFDLEKAKKLFEESGIPKEKIKLQAAYISSNQEYTSLNQLLQANLKKIGIDMELTPGIADTLIDQQRHLDTSYNTFCHMWWPTYPTPGDWLYGAFKTSEIGGWNMSFYSNPDVDALIEKGMQKEGPDRSAAIKAYQEAQQIIADEASTIFIADLHEIVVKRKDVKGFEFNPAYASQTFIFFYQLHRE